MSSDDANNLLAYWCSVAHRQKIFFLWRPCLRDPKDDMVLELAVAARAKFIVTFNLKDFAGVDRFGIEAVTPRDLLDRLEPDHGDPEP
jgi:predicted nucleic acid-binding protein